MKVKSKSINVIDLHTIRTAIDSLYAPVRVPVLTGLNNHHKASAGLDRGFLYIFSPPDFIKVIQREGQLVSCLLNYDYALSNSHHRTCRGEQKQTQKTVMMVMLIGTLN